MEENKIFELGGKIDELPDGTVIILHHESDDPQKSTDRALSMGYSLKLNLKYFSRSENWVKMAGNSSIIFDGVKNAVTPPLSKD